MYQWGRGSFKNSCKPLPFNPVQNPLLTTLVHVFLTVTSQGEGRLV